MMKKVNHQIALRLSSPDKQIIASVMIGKADVGILRRLSGIGDDSSPHFVKQPSPFQDSGVLLEDTQKGLRKHGMASASVIENRFESA